MIRIFNTFQSTCLLLNVESMQNILRPDSSPILIILPFVLISILVFIAVKHFFSKYIEELMFTAIKYQRAHKIYSEKSLVLQRAAFGLNIVMFLNFTLAMYQSILYFTNYVELIHPFILFLYCLGGILAYFIVKGVLYYIVAFVTKQVELNNEYLSNSMIYYRMAGVLFFPLIIIIPFSGELLVLIFLWTYLIIFFLANLAIMLRGVVLWAKTKFSYVYMILYFCVLELLPLLLVIKWSSVHFS